MWDRSGVPARRSRPSRPQSWAIGATRSSPAARPSSSTRSATSTECSTLLSERGARLQPCGRDPHPQRLRLRRTRALPGHRRHPGHPGRGVGRIPASVDRRRRADPARRRDAGRAPHPRSHRDPHDLPARGGRATGGRLHRRLDAPRLGGAHRPGRPLGHRSPQPSAAPLGDGACPTELPDDAAILPTHGFGSLCSAGFPVGAAGYRRRASSACREPGAAHGRGRVRGPPGVRAGRLSRATTRTSRRGTARERERPTSSCRRRATLAELAERARAGEWVVDLRERRAFAARHLVGTLAFELSDPLTTYLGWLLPWGSPLSLIGPSRQGPRGRSAGPGADRHREDRRLRRQRRRGRARTRGPVSRPGRTRWSASAT